MKKKSVRRYVTLALALLLVTSTAFAAEYRTLRPGENSAEIKKMQQALEYLRFPITVDGKYGNITESAVKAFQEQQRLTADGLAGRMTLTALFRLAPQFDYAGTPAGAAATNPPVEVTERILGIPGGKYRLGDEANGVRLIQQRLMELGYPVGKADAVYGRGTQDAVKLFQGANGLTADGIAGQGTMAKLFSSSAAPASSAPVVTPPAEAPTSPVETAPPSQAVGKATVYTANRGSLNARSSPQNLGSRNVVSTLPYGAELNLLQKAADWCRIEYAGITAYVMTQFLRFSDGTVPAPAPTPVSGQSGTVTHTALVATDDNRTLNFRSQPVQKSATFLAAIPHGTQLPVYVFSADWCQVLYQGRTGYVMTKFLSVAPVGETPAATPPAQDEVPPPATGRILRPDMQGDDVKAVQTRLKALNYDCSVTGTYDSGTQSAVRLFQSLNGLTADGICGDQTYTMLNSQSARPKGSTPLSYITLRVDKRDETVGMMQQRLKELGYPVNITGTFDMSTHQAVVSFEQRNGLTVSGIASPAMQQVLYGDGAKGHDTPVESLPSDAGKGGGVSSGSVKLLHWYKDIKPSVGSGQTATIYHPGSGISFTIRFYSMGAHADSEPLTWRDTQLMNRAFGEPSWNTNAVYVKLPNGVWTVASMHNRPHLTGSINNNGFGGHLCIHFLRDMDETQRNDPNFGVTNQNTIRSVWKSISGETLDY